MPTRASGGIRRATAAISSSSSGRVNACACERGRDQTACVPSRPVGFAELNACAAKSVTAPTRATPAATGRQR